MLDAISMTARSLGKISFSSHKFFKLYNSYIVARCAICVSNIRCNWFTLENLHLMPFLHQQYGVTNSKKVNGPPRNVNHNK